MAANTSIPRHLAFLGVLYFLASLAHFAHNAEFIALYPNMPAWLTREDVCLVWLGISALGAAALSMWTLGWRLAAALALAAYGALGLDGLAHYTLALCSEHTWPMNVTIWAEALAGTALAIAALRQAARRPWRTAP